MKKSLNNNQDTARHGEFLAERFLMSRGHSILARNYTTPFGEIDLITFDKGYTVFVEVKTRISEKYGSPLASITDLKKKHIIRNCEYFLMVTNKTETKCRIDVISINIDIHGDIQILKHIRSAIIKE